MNNKCIYYVEGPCEQHLVDALKEEPAKLIPGKVKVSNVILMFDTDVEQTSILKKNLELLNRYCGKLHIVFLPQVLNLEDELVRCTDVKNVVELTHSCGVRNFKTDFCKLKAKDCRVMLERHGLKTENLWATKVPEIFSFIEVNSNQVKRNQVRRN